MKLYSWHAAMFIIARNGRSSGQVATGTPPFGSFGGGPFDTVNLGNLNVHFSVPIFEQARKRNRVYIQPSVRQLTMDACRCLRSTVWQPAANWGWQGQTEVTTGYIIYSSKANKCFDPDQGLQTGNHLHLDGLSRPLWEKNTRGSVSICERATILSQVRAHVFRTHRPVPPLRTDQGTRLMQMEVLQVLPHRTG